MPPAQAAVFFLRNRMVSYSIMQRLARKRLILRSGRLRFHPRIGGKDNDGGRIRKASSYGPRALYGMPNVRRDLKLGITPTSSCLQAFRLWKVVRANDGTWGKCAGVLIREPAAHNGSPKSTENEGWPNLSGADRSKRTRYPNSIQFWGEQGTRRVFLFGRVPDFFLLRRFFPFGTVGSLLFAF